MVGASAAGLLAARIVSDVADEVVMIDRDVPPETPGLRRGVPQGFHAHNILAGGYDSIETLLPGIWDAIAKDGGANVDIGEGLVIYWAGNRFPHSKPAGMRHAVQSRVLLEHHIRKRVEALPKVRTRYGTYARGLDIADGRVRGVRLGREGEAIEQIPADIVILATGRSGRVLKWFHEHGYPSPPIHSIPVRLGYASRLYRGTPSVNANTPILACYGTRERTTRHGVALRIETGETLFTIMGYDRDFPPTEPEAFEAWTETLETRDIAMNIRAAEPTSKVHGFRVHDQYRRDWHKISLPEGVAVVGDAVCGLDPVFGQGISAHATQAMAVYETVQRRGFQSQAVQRAANRAILTPWLINSLEIARYPTIAPHVPLPPMVLKMARPLLDRIYSACPNSTEVYHEFLKIMTMKQGPYLSPANFLRVLRNAASGRVSAKGAPGEAG
ncbi:FAD dependent oxidoreductase [Plesiocystis pacifica SIR-1]|uniref:FAD dependent oxidoreductase n=1 Tax=Plesiocystis pacifica SIR-1 TaxID=391625 RepID=A6G763_9BACT|nr:FAD dependent oxidoreductase [Plesiocystis pacifica SIR-1]